MNDTIKERSNILLGRCHQADFRRRRCEAQPTAKAQNTTRDQLSPQAASGTFRQPDDDNFRFTCPGCEQHLRSNEQHRGTAIECPTCAAQIRIPDRAGRAVLILPPPQKLGVETHLPAQACSQSPSAGSSSLVPAGQAGPPQIPGAKSSAGGAGPRNMVCGALWCIGGIVVTVATYSAAEPGGTYLVAWGAILFGGLEFLQGLWQTSTEL